MTNEPTEADESSAPSRKLRERLARFVQRRRERAESAKSSFTIHIVAYGATNGLLMLINLITSPGFLWSLFPLAGWGIGLLHHYTEARTRERDARDAAALPPASSRTLQTVFKLFASRRGFRHHLCAAAGVSALMIALNAWLSSAAGPWSVLVVAPIGVSLAIHYAASRVRRTTLLGRLRKAGVELTHSAAREVLDDRTPPAHSALMAQALELRETILADLRDGGKEAARWRSELQPELDTYTTSIGTLLQARADLERAATRVSAAEVTRERDALRDKLEGASSADLKRQYQAAIDQYEGQLRTLQDLRERAEVIDLRTRSAVLALQQLSLDIPRLRTTPTEESAALSSLRTKSRELTQHLDDLRLGFDEIDTDGSTGTG